MGSDAAAARHAYREARRRTAVNTQHNASPGATASGRGGRSTPRSSRSAADNDTPDATGDGDKADDSDKDRGGDSDKENEEFSSFRRQVAVAREASLRVLFRDQQRALTDVQRQTASFLADEVVDVHDEVSGGCEWG